MIYTNDVSSTNGDAEIVLPADANNKYYVQRIICSYSGNVAIGAGNLKIIVGSITIIDVDLNASTNDFILPFSSDFNQAVTITLKGITLLKAKLSIGYDTIPNV